MTRKFTIEIELQSLEKTSNNNEGIHVSNEQLTELHTGNGDGAIYSKPAAAEASPLLDSTFPDRNGEMQLSEEAAKSQNTTVLINNNMPPHAKINSIKKVKKELNDILFWKVRLWMVIAFIFLLISATIGISLVICTVIHVDVDEIYDASSFVIPRYFNGSFQLTNQIMTDKPFTLSSNESMALSTELEQKLSEVYSSSPALGRYFSKAEIYAFRNGSVIAQFQLKFLMPVDHTQLVMFVLSRDMVYNVLKQNLYDQEKDQDPAYIDPSSLTINVADQMISKKTIETEF